MNEEWFWGLLAALILLALGTSLKAIEALHAKKLSDDEVARLRKQIDVLNETKNEALDAQKLDAQEKNKSTQSIHSQPHLYEILASIAKYRSQNLDATPKRIATDLALDPDIVLAHMWKYHNEQFITFNSGGAEPDINTSFFLSPKAWEFIAIGRV